MRQKTSLALAIFALVALSSLGLAQSVRKKLPREAEKMTASPVTSKADAVISKRLERDSPELNRVFADKKFIDACMILAMSGEMPLIDNPQFSGTEEKFEVVFAVASEASKAPGEYRQLVYSFDGKEAVTYFGEKNERYTAPKPVSGTNAKLQWPPPTPSWWPPKVPVPPWPGSGGGTVGLGGGLTNWGPWYQKSIDNCHFTLVAFCPVHAGQMREEERIHNGNSSIKQTRWILLRCGCY